MDCDELVQILVSKHHFIIYGTNPWAKFLIKKNSANKSLLLMTWKKKITTTLSYTMKSRYRTYFVYLSVIIYIVERYSLQFHVFFLFKPHVRHEQRKNIWKKNKINETNLFTCQTEYNFFSASPIKKYSKQQKIKQTCNLYDNSRKSITTIQYYYFYIKYHKIT